MALRDDILNAVRKAGKDGVTAGEIQVSPQFSARSYHGPVSGHLSTLHRNGDIARLTERRKVFLNGRERKFKVYVAAGNEDGRLTETQGH